MKARNTVGTPLESHPARAWDTIISDRLELLTEARQIQTYELSREGTKLFQDMLNTEGGVANESY